jgi:hypothetical protein
MELIKKWKKIIDEFASSVWRRAQMIDVMTNEPLPREIQPILNLYDSCIAILSHHIHRSSRPSVTLLQYKYPN